MSAVSSGAATTGPQALEARLENLERRVAGQDVELRRRLESLERLSFEQAAQLQKVNVRYSSLQQEHAMLVEQMGAAGTLQHPSVTPPNSGRQSGARVAVRMEPTAGAAPGAALANVRSTLRQSPAVAGVVPIPIVHKDPAGHAAAASRGASPGVSAVSTAAPPQTPRVAAQSAGIYVVGGHASGVTLAAVDRLNPSGQWEQLPPMPTPRHGCAAASVIGILYVFGGANDGGMPLGTAERFDPLLGRWERLPPAPTARHGSACAAAAGKLFCVGGYDGEGVLSVAERFDPVAGSWERLPPMPTARGRCMAAALEGLIYVAGGTDDGGQELTSFECIDAAFCKWRALPPMPTPRCGSAMSAGADGAVYVCGGRGGSEKLAVVERYDPVLEKWETVLSLPTARDGCAAAATSEGIYVFGGRGLGQTLPCVERFDMWSGVWEALPAMPRPRCGCAAASAEH